MLWFIEGGFLMYAVVMRALFTFATVSAALDCELVFKELDVPCRIIPVPRVLSASCAYAVTAETGDPQGLCAALCQRGVEYAGLFRRGALPGKGESYESLAGPGKPGPPR
jgi:hypothetical protein